MSNSTDAMRPPGWTGFRVVRPARDLAVSIALYRDLLRLDSRGGFENHDGYDGVFFALPGGGELELTAVRSHPTAVLTKTFWSST